MKELAIDIETYSSVDLGNAGVYRYAEADDFALLLFGYSVDGGAVRCVDVAQGEEIPADVLAALQDPSVTKTAYNAAFERVCLSRLLCPAGRYLDPSQWRCTMVAAARAGLPLPLGECAKAIGLEQGKMEEGRALIRYFSCPGPKGRRMPASAPQRWDLFKAYNIRDVEVEQAIRRHIGDTPLPQSEIDLYVADQEINDRGVAIDLTMARNAIRFDDENREALTERARRITGMDNPNSVSQIKAWLHSATGLSVASISKKGLDDMEKALAAYPEARELLSIRRQLGKTSNRKYQAMIDCVCNDGRIHGLLQFYGAARTGRWAGRLVQVQNLPQNHIEDIDRARRLVLAGDADDFGLNYADPSQTLSELIRTAFVAKPGCAFHVCDFSAIEARVIAWLAGERWLIETFEKGGDVYCAAASQMFGVPVEKHGANAELRQKGKIATLALGYGGGISALEAMGGARLGLTESEEREIVRLWRRSNPAIVRLWSILERAAVASITGKREIDVNRGTRVGYDGRALYIVLPSGRRLCYPGARLRYEADYNGEEKASVEYLGVDQTTRRWTLQRSYGGKLTENVVQAIARDILGDVLLRAREAGLQVVFHVHDEIIVEAPADRTLSEVEALFSRPPRWCYDLPLKGAGYSTPYYLKD